MKLLVILSRVPYPLEKGDKLRAYHQIRCLSKYHKITLIALTDQKIHPQAKIQLSQFCQEVYFLKLNKLGIFLNIIKAFFNGLPLQVGYFYNKKIRKKINSIIHELKPEHIYCQLIRTAEYTRHVDIPKTIDFQDTFSIGMKRRYEKSNSLFKPFLYMEYKRLVKYERTVFDLFDSHTLISYPDRDFFPHPLKNKIFIIRNGVDIKYFTSESRIKKYEVIFTGNMAYPPNIDAATFLATEIMPLVRKRFPQAYLVLAGTTPHLKVKRLSDNYTIVTGWVDDIRPWYDSSKVFIAPMRLGTGLQNKLLEAMAMHLPCITSSLANEALHAIPNEEILIGNSAQEYANHIIELLVNPVLYHKLSLNGHRFVTENYSWEKATKKLDAILTNQLNKELD
ncbi:MAG TPA: glycosyltransferase [Bacteroidales bacterium]|nr:glycosyltransferase [Bacteroidales bacterium]